MSKDLYTSELFVLKYARENMLLIKKTTKYFKQRVQRITCNAALCTPIAPTAKIMIQDVHLHTL